MTREMADKFNIFREKQNYFDIEIETDSGSIFYYNKYGLIRTNSYFERMFSSGMKETIENKIKFNCSDLTTLSILYFCHTDKIEIVLDNFVDMFTTCHMYDLQKIVAELKRYFKTNFKALEDIYGWVEILRFSKLHFPLNERVDSFRQHYRNTFQEKIKDEEIIQSITYTELTCITAALTTHVIQGFTIWGKSEKNRKELIQDVKGDTIWWVDNYCEEMLPLFQDCDRDSLLFFFNALSKKYFEKKSR